MTRIHRLLAFAVAILLVAFLAACGGSASFSVNTGSSSSSSSSSSGGLTVRFGVSPLETASASAIQGFKTAVVKDPASLASLLSAHFGKPGAVTPDVSTIDFSRQTVFAVFGGPASSCDSLQIEDLSQDAAGAVNVSYRLITPDAATSCVAMLSYPMQMVVADIAPAAVQTVNFLAQESARALRLTTLDRGDSPGISQARNVLVSDSTSFNALIQEHLAGVTGRYIDTSSLDFAKRTVIGSFLGSKAGGACTQAQIENAALTASGVLSVMVREVAVPAGQCPYSSVARPMHLASIETAPGTIKQTRFNTQRSSTLVLFSPRDYHTQSSGTTRDFAAATDDAAFAGIWNRHNGARQTFAYPRVDFASQTVGALFYGSQADACTTPQVARVERIGKNADGKGVFRLYFHTARTGAACTAQVINPSELITVPEAKAVLQFTELP